MVAHDLRQLNRLAGLGLLSATIAHEIKNALVPVKTYIGLLLEKGGETELTGLMQEELDRIDNLANRMVHGSQPRDRVVAPLRLHEVVQHTLSLIRKESTIKLVAIETSLAASSDVIRGNAGDLQQAFLNLFLNALEAMEAGGTLKVSTSFKAGDTKHSPGVAVVISDTGTGISPEHLQRLFQPFFSTKPNGTGLGLLITKQIIEEHAGAIRVESGPGKGTTFYLEFPAHEAA